MTRGRIASLVLVLGLLGAVLLEVRAGHIDYLRCLALFGMPMAVGLLMIWFPEALGRYTGPTDLLGENRIDEVTPPLMVSVVGWLVLVGFTLFLFWFAKS